ncbi:CmlA/FloR family chloramphenicol efflux MFS transporter [Caulobacter mirabilis]|uniref:Bcr/CflA family efflux transporter n=1 Tax=Caulobacter mirabilis TaxID=69666 RepID=A0A2D2AZR7_9CAUL|nr:chloramphenicol efflux MFS transporter [Caulobacter mirabilis]
MPAQNPGPSWPHALPAALLLMAPFDVLASLAMDIYLPVVPSMPEALRTTPAVVQLTLSLYMVVLGLGQLAFGPLSDRIGRRPVLLGGGLLFAVASFGLALAPDAGLFVALRLLQAAGASAALVATFATVRDVYAQRPEGTTIYAAFGAILSFVPALGPILGALIAGGLGWRAIFAALGGLALLALANALRGWRETLPPRVGAAGPTPQAILASGSFWTYTLGFSAAMGAFFVFFSTAPRVLIDQAGYSQLGFSLAFATAALVMIATARLARRLVERWGVPGTLKRGLALMLLGAGLLAAGQVVLAASFASFVAPMWVVCVGLVLVVSVSANGALAAFGAGAGLATALYFAIQSLIVGTLGTLAVMALGGDTAWPLVGWCLLLPLTVLGLLRRLKT